MKNALCLGTFDGVHLGHMAVLSLPEGYKKIAVSFSKPPKAIISGNYELITEPSYKDFLLKKAGIEEIVNLQFSLVKDMLPCDFLEDLKKKYSPSLISCGFNYHFGKNGQGNIDTLKVFCAKNDIELRLCEPVTVGEETVSSTAIRKYLKNGEVKKAAQLLGREFHYEAEVIRGDKRGRELGFPTANQKYPNELVRLKFGVYKTKIEFDGKTFYGITNIGIRPTFETKYIISETFIKDFSGDLYGKVLKVTPLEFLREERRFNSLSELKIQIEKDFEKI